MGSALFVDGHVIPLEFGHHPWKDGKTYEERLSDAVCKKIGAKKWKQRVNKAIEQWQPIFNPRYIYLGGGNARLSEKTELPTNVRIVNNDAGMLGGIALWHQPG
jgi:polyphosphate glucokinase